MWLKLANGTYVNLNNNAMMGVRGHEDGRYSVYVVEGVTRRSHVVCNGYEKAEHAEADLERFMRAQDYVEIVNEPDNDDVNGD